MQDVVDMSMIRRREQPRDAQGRFACMDPMVPRRRLLHVWLAEPELRFLFEAKTALDVGYTDLILAAFGADDRLRGSGEAVEAVEAPEEPDLYPDTPVKSGLQIRLTDAEYDMIRSRREILGLSTRAFLLSAVQRLLHGLHSEGRRTTAGVSRMP